MPFALVYRLVPSGLVIVNVFVFPLLIDNEIVAEADVGTSHNDTLTRVIPLTDVTTGMHTLQVYFIANGISSNVINTYLICNKDESRTAPIVGLSFNNTEIN